MAPLRLIPFLILALIGCNTNVSEDQNSSTEPDTLYRFFVAGHTYGEPGTDHPGLAPAFEAAYIQLNQQKHLAFGVLTGDVVFQSDSTNWAGVDSSLKQLRVPVYIAPGNHDQPTNWAPVPSPAYLHFVHQKDLFVLLDPNQEGWRIDSAQLVWFKGVLQQQETSVNRIFVFAHQLIWWNEAHPTKDMLPNSFLEMDSSLNYWSEVEPLLRNTKKPTYLFAGDVGAFDHRPAYGFFEDSPLLYTASGMGGLIQDHYLEVTVLSDSVCIQPIPIGQTDATLFQDLSPFQIPNRP